LTPYVVTRWFRAPELLLKYQTKNYTSKIDMWSAGCVLAELYLKKVLFGEKDMAKQVQRFVALLGALPQHLMDQIKDQSVRNFLNDCVKKTKRVSFEELFPGIEKDALDLLRRLLCYDPAERISAEEALEHPFFKELHTKEPEGVQARIDYFDFEFEQYTLDRKILRELIMDEILLYHSKDARDYYEKCKAKYPKGVLEILYQRVGAAPTVSLPPTTTSNNSSACKQAQSAQRMDESMEDVDTAPGTVNSSAASEKKQQEAAQHAKNVVA
jgi:serine/threonine protein kinase